MSFAFIKNPLIALPSVNVGKEDLTDSDLIISINNQQLLVVDYSPLIAIDRYEFIGDAKYLQLGQFNNQSVFICSTNNEISKEASEYWWGLRRIALNMPADLASIAAQASAINHWHQNYRFCGKCGSKTRLGKEHSRVCISNTCNTVRFPRIDPCIIVAVVNDDNEILLGRQAGWEEGMYSVLAGFLSHGESLEQCVKREVKEEAGIIVDSVEYVASQPWPFPGSLMIGFNAKAKNQTINFEDDELQDAIWISRQALLDKVKDKTIKLSHNLSISRYLLDRWLNKQAL